MRIAKRVLLGIAVVFLLALAAFTVWAYTPLGPMPEALAALESDDQVQVTEQPWLTFRPVGMEPTAGLVFYPGGRIDPRSYAPAAHEIASRGYLVVIVPMPFNLAVFGANRAADVIATYPQIQHWAVGGHSLGGAMAASYLYGRPAGADGLVLWASYPAGNNGLADRALAVTSVYGTADGVATPDTIAASRPLLPPDTRWVPIQGGNHAQFGWYGPQPGDGTATISREAQQEQAITATVDLLKALTAPSQ
jgi:pimeloyl-ACP methyl ester carboxylesterase